MRRLLVLLAALALLAPAAAAHAQSPTTLVVVEVAEVGVAPDAATVRAEVSRRAGTAGRARALVERRVAAALRSLEALGIPRADVQTSAIESYRGRRKGRRFFFAATALTIRVADVGAVSAVIGALRGTDVTGPDFTVSDPTAARQQATTLALQRARARADAAAAALGLRVVSIRRVDLNPEVGYGSGTDDEEAGGGAGRAGGGPPVQVEPGEETVEVAVAVVYVLG